MQSYHKAAGDPTHRNVTLTPITMFDGFQQQTDKHSRRRFAASTALSAVLCLVVTGAVVALAARPHEKPKKDPVKVTFYRALPAPEVKPPAPKPSPPKPRPKRKMRKRRSRGQTTSPDIPVDIPEEALAEGDESQFEAGEITTEDILGTKVGSGDAEMPPPPPAGKTREQPIYIPDNADPPRPHDTNRVPVYPEEQRRNGIEDVVVFKVVINEHGAVTDILVLKGDEPFLSAARTAVSTWRYRPATVDGEPRAVYRIIKIPFKLRG